MKSRSAGRLLRIHIGESDHHGRKPLYQAIVELLREQGMAGATVLRGVEGFGASNVLHKPHALHLSADYPIVIGVADSEETIREILPMLDEMIADGLITSERVEIVAYRAAPQS
jgi:uncharacterized protein